MGCERKPRGARIAPEGTFSVALMRLGSYLTRGLMMKTDNPMTAREPSSAASPGVAWKVASGVQDDTEAPPAEAAWAAATNAL